MRRLARVGQRSAGTPYYKHALPEQRKHAPPAEHRPPPACLLLVLVLLEDGLGGIVACLLGRGLCGPRRSRLAGQRCRGAGGWAPCASKAAKARRCWGKAAERRLHTGGAPGTPHSLGTTLFTDGLAHLWKGEEEDDEEEGARSATASRLCQPKPPPVAPPALGGQDGGHPTLTHILTMVRHSGMGVAASSRKQRLLRAVAGSGQSAKTLPGVTQVAQEGLSGWAAHSASTLALVSAWEGRPVAGYFQWGGVHRAHKASRGGQPARELWHHALSGMPWSWLGRSP